MKDSPISSATNKLNRRSLIKGSLMAGGVAALSTTLLTKATPALAQGENDSRRGLDRGDIAILRFLAAAEIIESDLWVQYNELGGLTSGVPIEDDPNQPLNAYQAAFSNLDGDGPQYITSNTIDEISHATFLNAYLESRGAEPVNFDEFRTLQGSMASGAQNIGRLTNLGHLNVDTSFFTRYRSTPNPDVTPSATFPQAVTISNRRGIPLSDADLNDPAEIQVIANTAAFHFAFIEGGGTSLYATMAQKANHPEVLQIVLGIGGDEIAHFLEWVDFAGNGVQPPVAPVSFGGLTFPDFFATHNPQIQPSLIFPIPAQFISTKLPLCATIRPITDKFAGARAAVAAFTNDGLFTGQPKSFHNLLLKMADEADAASRNY
jgi:hypothetical protein